MKKTLWILAAVAYVYLCGWVFNHGWPWVGIGLAIVGLLVGLHKAKIFVNW